MIYEQSSHIPPCPHFEVCGACKLQHMNDDDYYAFKQNMLLKTIESLGLSHEVIAPIVKVGEGARRRIQLKARMNKNIAQVGFFAAKTHDIFDLNVCLVSDIRLVSFIPRLKQFIVSLKKPSIIQAISMTALDSGLDIILTLSGELQANDLTKLLEFAKQNPIIRLSKKQGESDAITTIFSSGEALIKFGEYEVELPAGAFLQATKQGEHAISKIVREHLQPCQKIADLYSGCGTFSFPLLSGNKYIAAFEGSYEMVAAMYNAIIRANLDGRISATARDLFKNPLNADKLKAFDGVVINPPRNGALPQVQQIAKSGIERVVMVSCNPTTFARDAAQLLQAGYQLSSATAIDQFYWSNHLEVVATFSKTSNA